MALHGASRRAFTLMELLVSVAILAGLMVMVGTVFTTATRASGKAATFTTLQRHQRQALDMIRADLAGTNPGTGVMALAGFAFRAFDTPEKQAAGSPIDQVPVHRADVLMLFTQRPVETYVFQQQDPDGQPLATPIAISPTVQVVYGHADFAELVENPSGSGLWAYDTNQLRRIEPASLTAASPVPACQWHLARRVVAFPEGPDPQSAPGRAEAAGPLTSDGFLEAVWDLTWNTYNAPTDATSVLGNTPAGVFWYDWRSGFPLQYCLLRDDINNCWFRRIGPFGQPWMMFEGGYWYRPVGGPQPWGRTADGMPYLSNVMRTVDDLNNASGQLPLLPGQLFYNPMAQPEMPRRTVLDPTPPPAAADRLAFAFLPNCSDFKVEFTYDDPQEAWQPQGAGAAEDIPRPIFWEAVPHGQMWIWSKVAVGENLPSAWLPPEAAKIVSQRRQGWPRAVRVTLTVWDENARSEEPVVQTLIHIFH